jgi:protein farnesyltransferase subunit beta
MDNSILIEQKQFQLNQIELIYQEGLKKNLSLKLNIFQKNKNLLAYIKKKKLFQFSSTKKFLNEFKKKFGFFYFPIHQSQSWFFFWFLNSIKFLKINSKFYFLKKIKKILLSIFFYNGKRVESFPNSTNLILLYASILSFFFSFKLPTKIKRNFLIKVYSFLKKLFVSFKFFRCSILGEIDQRGFFCSLVIFSIFNFFTKKIIFIIKKKFFNFYSFDGCLCFEKFEESHGALIFCFLSSLIFFSTKNFSIKTRPSFKIWFFEKMKFFDFGFQGRFYKIVDSCYIFWFLSIAVICSYQFSPALIIFLSNCNQTNSKGFSDYVGKTPDLYHTWYSICSLSLIVFFGKNNLKDFSNKKKKLKLIFFFPKLNPIYGIREIDMLQSF